MSALDLISGSLESEGAPCGTSAIGVLWDVRFIETPIFTDDVSQELPLEGYRQLQLALMLRPEQGAVIVGSGGLRKLRWRRAGTGKRGGLRVIYYWEAASETFYMLAVYRKSAQADLSAAQVRVLSRLVTQEFK